MEEAKPDSDSLHYCFFGLGGLESQGCRCASVIVGESDHNDTSGVIQTHSPSLLLLFSAKHLQKIQKEISGIETSPVIESVLWYQNGGDLQG